MITIITGNVDSGKTTTLISLFQPLRDKAEGFAIPKCFQSNHFVGQQLMNLQSGHTMPFSYTVDHFPSEEEIQLKYDRFIILREGLAAADGIIQKARLNRTENIFVDEFGPIEVLGLGLWPTYQRLIDNMNFSNTNIYMAVRKDCLESCIKILRLPLLYINVISL